MNKYLLILMVCSQVSALEIQELFNSAQTVNKDIKNAQNILKQAKTEKEIINSQREVLILESLEAEQQYQLAQKKLQFTELEVLNNIVQNYTQIIRNLEDDKLNSYDVILAEKNLEAEQTKEKIGMGTYLHTLSSSNQLNNAKFKKDSNLLDIDLYKKDLFTLAGKEPQDYILDFEIDENFLDDKFLNDDPEIPLQIFEIKQKLEKLELTYKLNDHDFVPSREKDKIHNNLQQIKETYSNSFINWQKNLDNLKAKWDKVLKLHEMAKAKYLLTEKEFEIFEKRYLFGDISQIEKLKAEKNLQVAKFELEKTKIDLLLTKAEISLAFGKNFIF